MARQSRRAAAPTTVSASGYRGPERRRWVNRSWPLPAFAAWAMCWIVFAVAAHLGLAPAAGLRCRRRSRRGARAARRDAVAPRLHRLRLSALVRRVGQRRRRCAVGLAAAAGAARLRLSLARLARRAALSDADRRAARPRGTRSARRRLGRARCRLRPGRRAGRAAPRVSGCGARRHRMELAAAHRLRVALPLRARPARRSLVARLVAATRWSISSSGRRAWSAPPPRRPASCAKARGW